MHKQNEQNAVQNAENSSPISALPVGATVGAKNAQNAGNNENDYQNINQFSLINFRRQTALFAGLCGAFFVVALFELAEFFDVFHHDSASAFLLCVGFIFLGIFCATVVFYNTKKDAQILRHEIAQASEIIGAHIAKNDPCERLAHPRITEFSPLFSAVQNATERVYKDKFFDENNLANADLFVMQISRISPLLRQDFFVCALHVSNLNILLKILPSQHHAHFFDLLAQRLKNFAAHLSGAYLAKAAPGEFLFAFSSRSPAKITAHTVHLGLQTTLENLRDDEQGFELNLLITCGFAPLAADARRSVANAQKAALAAKDYLIYERSLDEMSAMQERLCSDLASAICREQLWVLYQPKISASGRIFGAEALVRWRRDGEQNYFNTQDFIEIAQSHGLIEKLEKIVIKQVCKDLAKLRAAGQNLSISINISAEHFEDESLADFLQKNLQKNGLLPSDIELEITERDRLSRRAQANIVRLSALDFAISLDDFGRDYNSISRLCALPASTLKIDKIFVDGLLHNHEIYSKIIKSIITMARDLGKKVIAEGVETAEQKEALKALGCEAFQGFYYHRALEFDDLLRVLIENKTVD